MYVLIELIHRHSRGLKQLDARVTQPTVITLVTLQVTLLYVPPGLRKHTRGLRRSAARCVSVTPSHWSRTDRTARQTASAWLHSSTSGLPTSSKPQQPRWTKLQLTATVRCRTGLSADSWHRFVNQSITICQSLYRDTQPIYHDLSITVSWYPQHLNHFDRVLNIICSAILLSYWFPSSSWSCQCPCGCGTVVKRHITSSVKQHVFRVIWS